ncbi:hypothetical protein BBP40_000343 [Aspergillus hancockii]|nr:hypothetical protein BBP40_000343 [Aspergillus hancockii]
MPILTYDRNTSLLYIFPQDTEILSLIPVDSFLMEFLPSTSISNRSTEKLLAPYGSHAIHFPNVYKTELDHSVEPKSTISSSPAIDGNSYHVFGFEDPIDNSNHALEKDSYHLAPLEFDDILYNSANYEDAAAFLTSSLWLSFLIATRALPQ